MNETAIAAATALGTDHGQDAAAWWAQEIIGGRSSGDTASAARRILAGLADGDPEIMDTLPSADLSGEMADGMTVARILDDVGLAGIEVAGPAAAAIADAYKDAFNDAAQVAVEAACLAVAGANRIA